MKGTVKWFNKIKKIGFAEGDDKEDYFLHESNQVAGQQLEEGQEIEFEKAKNEKGNYAKDIIGV